MTEIADDRSWWTDVEHLRPGGESARPGRLSVVSERTDVDPGPDRDHRPVVRRPGRDATGPEAAPKPTSKPAVLKRADAAAFADAMDLDGAFGAPTAPRSREIILSRHAGPADEEVVEADASEDDDTWLEAARPTGRVTRDGRGDPIRRTVQIASSGVHTDLADRRALREVAARAPRTPVERAGTRPDRIAMWVVMLGICLVLIAATSSSAGA